MSDFTQAELDDFRVRLTEVRAEIEATLAATAEGAKPVDLEEPFGRLSRMDAIQRQKITEANRARLKVRLRHVMAAFAALRDDEYGYCRKCDEMISHERLEARPEAPVCLHCAEQLEGQT